MRRALMSGLLAASMLTGALPLPGGTAWAESAVPQIQSAPPAQTGAAQLPLDQSQLPPLRPIIPVAQRDQMVLMASGAGAAIGILLADLVTGGLLLAPLGVPSASQLFVAGAAGAAAPTYSVAQRVLAGVATMAAAVGGGYLGGYVARSRPDFIRLGD